MLAKPQFISQLRDHTESAVLALIDRYYTPINRYLCRLVSDPQIAAELTQDTFLDAYLALPRLTDDTNLSAWLYRIATNNARSYLRRQRVLRWLPLDWLLPQPSDHEERIVRQDLIDRAMAQLQTDQQACLLLHGWVGLTCAEIGQVLGKSENAVKMILMRARRCFRDAYIAAGGRMDTEVEL